MTRALRNIAIIAHVDHGKTTLVDKLLRQSGTFAAHEHLVERVMDSNDLERERGITILAKNCAVTYNGTHINIVDTPGHADFGGEVERVLSMVDGVILLVDAAEGPMPQTRFVLKKALARGLLPIVVINKIDRPDQRAREVVDEVFDLMVDLKADDEQLDFPVLFASGRRGYAMPDLDDPPQNLIPLFEAILRRVPPPRATPDEPLQLQVTSLDYSDYTGRIAIGRVARGTLRSGARLKLVKRDGTVVDATVKRVSTFEGLRKEPRDVVETGDICAIEGVSDVDIGDTFCDPLRQEPLTAVHVDEPTISMFFQVNDGPFVGKDGKYVTSRQIRDRLQRELLKNVALRVEDTDRPEVLKVSGRGVLHLGVLIENMRREGFELCVGKPKVIFKEENGERLEPVELVSCEVPDTHAGKVIEILGRRRGELVSMESRDGHASLEFHCPSRGLIGIRNLVLTATQGEAILHSTFMDYEPYKGPLAGRTQGVLISLETGSSNAYAMFKLKDRGTFFIDPGEEVYEGMIVGEHCKDNDLVVNCCRAKKLTNIRTTSADEKLTLPPPRRYTVEAALEYIEDDELVEITPTAVRLRKTRLKETERKRSERADD
ncbi:MAG TPA: translational GTPase TypA [Planctomycetota bacterium]|nr:translational GTPase TypA [Planctomycetota bacterium]